MAVAQSFGRDGLIDFCAVAMMQKDEGDVLRAWIDHYTSLFVPHALTIFDNGSTDRETLDQLKRAEAVGICVDRSQPGVNSFMNKGDILVRRFRALDRRYAFFYPCDCDELLVSGEPVHGRALGEALRQEFAALGTSNATIFRIAREYRNAPGSTLFSVQPCLKLMFKEVPPPSLDRGLHLYDFPNNIDAVPGIAPCRFAQIHFHHKPFDLALKAARLKMRLHTPTFERSAMRNYTGPGEHLRPLFGMTAERYLDRMSAGADIDLSDWLERRGIAAPYAGDDSVRFDRDERVIFERRPLNAAIHYEASGLGEAVVTLLEPMLWHATSFIEFAGSGSALRLAREAGVEQTLSIRAERRWLAGRASPPSSDGVEFRQLSPLPSRRAVAAYATIPPGFHRPAAVLVAGIYRFAVLCRLYEQLPQQSRICVPGLSGWRRAEDLQGLFETAHQLGGAAVLAPKPGQQALAARLFRRYWRDAS